MMGKEGKRSRVLKHTQNATETTKDTSKTGRTIRPAVSKWMDRCEIIKEKIIGISIHSFLIPFVPVVSLPRKNAKKRDDMI